MALKEEQFCRQVQKAEAQAKADGRKTAERYESEMHGKKREYQGRLDDLEDRLSSKADEAEMHKRVSERL